MGEHSRLYNNRRWRSKRAALLARYPLCKMCAEQGKTTPATVADHVRPHKGDLAKFWGGALQSLCKECHDRHKKMEEQGLSMGCNADGLPLDDKHPWNQRKKGRGK